MCICIIYQEDGYTVHSFVLSCSVGPPFIWIPRFLIIYIYRATVLGVGAVFAYLVRHIKINPLNDSRFMAAFIPIAVAVSISGNLTDFLLHQLIGVNTFASVLSMFIFTAAVLLFSVLFIPTVLQISL